MTDPNRPAKHLVDCRQNWSITDPCGCNQPEAVHSRGDAGFCRATLAAGVGYPEDPT